MDLSTEGRDHLTLPLLTQETLGLKSESSCNTDTEIIKTSFLWTIKNLNRLPEKIGQSIESLSFHSREDPQTKWKLKLYPNGETEKSKGFVFYYLYLEDTDRIQNSLDQLRVEYKFELFVGNKNIRKESEKVSFRKKDRSGSFISKTGCSYNFLLPSNDELNIYCEVYVYGKTVTISGTNVTEVTNVIQKSPKSALNQIKSLFESQKYSDIDIVIGSNRFKAHKALLSLNSPVFEKMFEHPLKESLTNELPITDISEDIFREVLRFIYNDKVVIKDFNCGSDLLIVAEKYQMIELKNKCEEYLISQLSVQTVCYALILADMYSAEQLKRSAIKFFKNNSFEVMTNKNWSEVLKREDLLSQVLNEINIE